MTCQEMKDQILEWTAEKPKSAEEAVIFLMTTPTGREGLAELFRAIGINLAWQLFDFLSADSRAELEALLKRGASPGHATRQLYEAWRCFRAYFQASVDAGNSPFWFLEEWGIERAVAISRDLSAEELAIVCSFVETNLFNQLIEALPTEKRASLILALGRTSRLPRANLCGVATQVAEHILSRCQKPEKVALPTTPVDPWTSLADLTQVSLKLWEEKEFDRILDQGPKHSKSMKFMT